MDLELHLSVKNTFLSLLQKKKNEKLSDTYKRWTCYSYKEA